jgi:very-short-patch-repair endonuclease
MVVFTSFDPSMIDLNRTSARAILHLKEFLEFSNRGLKALAEANQGSRGGFESPFEEAVAIRLREKGWQVIPQVGVSRFRIDLGIVHPDRTGDFLAGVECDGTTYHSAATARDRDMVRASVLENLGWKLRRVWSTDWFVDPAKEVERLDEALQKLHRADKATREEQERRRNQLEKASGEKDLAGG